jgi:hypothetical protein
VTKSFRRLPQGGRIDRKKPVSARFDGKPLSGLGGDTLASALLANGKVLIGRSFKYHRPRGILAAGIEEPNALVTIGEGATTEPNVAATMVDLVDGLSARSQNAWPSPDVRPHGGEFAALAAVPVRLLLQDLHGPDQGLLDVLRTLHPQGGGAWAFDRPSRSGPL